MYSLLKPEDCSPLLPLPGSVTCTKEYTSSKYVEETVRGPLSDTAGHGVEVNLLAASLDAIRMQRQCYHGDFRDWTDPFVISASSSTP